MIKYNKIQVYISTILEWRLLFHGREKITNKIAEIQKKNHKKNRYYTHFLFCFFVPSFSLLKKNKIFSLKPSFNVQESLNLITGPLL
jgi:hypothetical protein